MRREMVRSVLLWLVVLLLVSPGEAVDPRSLRGKAEEAIRVWQRVQGLEDKWAEERQRLMEELRDLELRKRRLLWQREKLKGYVADVKHRIEEHRRRIEELRKIHRELEPYLDETVKRLGQFVEKDLPFLRQERRNRLTSLKEELNRYDATLSEKLRRVLEALRIEVQYGLEVEVTEEEISLPEGPRTVQVLRFGRLALFYRSLDGERVGRYNPVAGRWEELPGRFRRDLERAVEMAQGRRAAELVRVPLGGLR